jgi:hypothetical protein
LIGNAVLSTARPGRRRPGRARRHDAGGVSRIHGVTVMPISKPSGPSKRLTV